MSLVRGIGWGVPLIAAILTLFLLAGCASTIAGQEAATLTIVAPADGSRLSVGEEFTVRAVVAPPGALAGPPDLIVGSALIDTLTDEGGGIYSTTISLPAAASYSIRVAGDLTGGERLSAGVTVTAAAGARDADGDGNDDGTGDGTGGGDDGGTGEGPGSGSDDGTGDGNVGPGYGTGSGIGSGSGGHGDGGGTDGTTGAFTIVVVPDTQNMIGKYQADNDMTSAMMEWIVASAGDLNTVFVTQVGDVVDYGWNRAEWAKANASYGILDGHLPYSVALGDHDYRLEEEMDSGVARYVENFGPTRYAGRPWYGGSNPRGTSHYQLFETGRWQFLHIALEWEAPGPADDTGTPLGWARQVLEDHPGLPTIITTHAYLWDLPGQEGYFTELEGTVKGGDGTVTYPGSTGRDIFEALVEPYPQVFMVLNGHYHFGSGTNEGEYHQVSTNGAGLPVYEMLTNYQEYPNGGDGWLRILEFRPGGGESGLDRISARTYSPVLDQFQKDARSLFHFDLSFDQRFGSD